MSRPALKPLDQQVIVITGASSGIGLATARRAAQRGARVFLIARNEPALRALCEELQATGARAAYAVCDVADAGALAEAAERCVRLFGGVDTWVNNAGVSIYGPIRETPPEDHRRLFETNYWGVVNGSLTAVEHIRARPGGGAVITVGSVLGDAPIPVQGVYSASKHAVRGFTNALRMELMREGTPISLTLVKPAAIDTPYKDHARNLTSAPMRNPGPVYAAHVVADVILHCAEHPVREITVGGGGRAIAAFHHLLPGVAEPLFAALAPLMHRDRRARSRVVEDALWDPTEDALREEADYPFVRQTSWLAQARMHPRAAVGGVLALFLVLAGVVAARRLARPRVRPAPALGWRARLGPEAVGAGLGRIGRGLKQRYEALDTRELRGRAGAAADRAGRFAREHPAESVGALGGLVALVAAVATTVALRQGRES